MNCLLFSTPFCFFFSQATLSFDRRFIDEHLAAEFMSTFRRVIENPQYMNIGPVPIVRASAASAAGGLY